MFNLKFYIILFLILYHTFFLLNIILCTLKSLF